MKVVLGFIITVLGTSTLGAQDHLRKPQKPCDQAKEYYLEPFYKGNWYKANAYCGSRGMRLITIKTREDNLAIYALIKDAGQLDQTYWAAGTNFGDTKYYWITDNAYLSFDDWYKGQPDNFGNKQNCLALSAGYRHQWDDLECDSIQGIICEEFPKNTQIDNDIILTSRNETPRASYLSFYGLKGNSTF